MLAAIGIGALFFAQSQPTASKPSKTPSKPVSKSRRRRNDLPEASGKQVNAIRKPKGSFRFSIDDRAFMVKWVKGNPYLYERHYEGTRGNAVPIWRDEYLGRIDNEVALRADAAELAELVRKL